MYARVRSQFIKVNKEYIELSAEEVKVLCTYIQCIIAVEGSKKDRLLDRSERILRFAWRWTDRGFSQSLYRQALREGFAREKERSVRLPRTGYIWCGIAVNDFFFLSFSHPHAVRHSGGVCTYPDTFCGAIWFDDHHHTRERVRERERERERREGREEEISASSVSSDSRTLAPEAQDNNESEKRVARQHEMRQFEKPGIRQRLHINLIYGARIIFPIYLFTEKCTCRDTLNYNLCLLLEYQAIQFNDSRNIYETYAIKQASTLKKKFYIKKNFT